MSANYTPLQGGPPPYNDIVHSGTQTEQSSAGNKNECLKPGELARVVHDDPIVKIVPLRGARKSSPIEIRRSVLPPRSHLILTQLSWMVISLALLYSNYRFEQPPMCDSAIFFATISSSSSQFNSLIERELKHILDPNVISINVLCLSILQLILTIVCYRVAKEYFAGTFFALIAMVLFGSYSVFAVYSYCYRAGEAALTVVDATVPKTADERCESDSMYALMQTRSTSTARLESEKCDESQVHVRSRSCSALGSVWSNDRCVKVELFDGHCNSPSIIVRPSVLPLSLRRVALLLEFLWIPIPFVSLILGACTGDHRIPTLGSLVSAFNCIAFPLNTAITTRDYLLLFVPGVFFTVMVQLFITVEAYYYTRVYFAPNLCWLVAVVLFGMVSIAVVYQYHYQAGRAALDALAAERARSSPEDDDSHEGNPTSKKTR